MQGHEAQIGFLARIQTMYHIRHRPPPRDPKDIIFREHPLQISGAFQRNGFSDIHFIIYAVLFAIEGHQYNIAKSVFILEYLRVFYTGSVWFAQSQPDDPLVFRNIHKS